MRHKGSVSHICLERDKIIPALFRKAKGLVEWPADTMDICKKAATLPVSEFYVSSDAAVEYIRNRFYHKKKKVFRSEYKQKLYDALYERFKELIALPDNVNRPLPEVVIKALASPAPCSGISPFQIYYTILKHKKK